MIEFVTSEDIYRPEFPNCTFTVASCHKNEQAAISRARETKRHVYLLCGDGRNPRIGDELLAFVENGFVYLIRPASNRRVA